MEGKKVLVIGGGGREHALGWKIAQSPLVAEVLYAPGNAGTAREVKGRNLPHNLADKKNLDLLPELIESENIDMIVVGPEQPLVDGIVDYLGKHNFHRVFGPSAEAAELESDKFVSYEIMEALGIPQADSALCYSIDDAIEAIKERATPDGIVIKAYGLTGGKGVSVCDSKEQALDEIHAHMERFKQPVLIAERLFGEEFSAFGISDGHTVYPIRLSTQDHKPLLNGDKGPNTGGMGAYGPAPIAPAEVVQQVADEIMTPVVRHMREKGTPYIGFLYAGMIRTDDGLKVLEFNVRMGDPECQPTMLMIKSDLYQAMDHALRGSLDQISLEFNPGAACTVVMASKGYPESYDTGFNIYGLGTAESLKDVKVFHAGTKQDIGNVVTSGGRVLGVTAYSPEGIVDAQNLAYRAVKKISIDGPEPLYFRKDIADKAIR